MPRAGRTFEDSGGSHATPQIRHIDPVRVLRGRADWPRMRLRWQLSIPAGASRLGEEWLSDMTYLERLPPVSAASEALPYDLRMVDDWFRARIVQGQPPR